MKNDFRPLRAGSCVAFAVFVLLSALSWAGSAQAGYPVPQIVGPTRPSAVVPGGPDFTLHVYGANFLPNATVYWSGQPRVTTYISGHELDAQILASDIAAPTAGFVTVVNQSPNEPLSSAASSSYAQVEVHTPRSSFSAPGAPEIYWGLGSVNYIADINGDGYLDILGFPSIVSTARALLNNGDGTFRNGPYVTFDAYLLGGATVSLLTFGDFNGDGQLDLVYNKGRDSSNTYQSFLAVNFGNGDTNFIPGPTSAKYRNPKSGTVESPLGGVVGDFNGDGILDVAVLPWQSRAPIISLYLGNGDGTFRHGIQFWAPVCTFVIAGDFNNDGILDLVTYGPTTTTDAAIFLGNGDGTFQPIQKIGTATKGPNAIFGILQVTDLNEDGNLDVIVNDGSGIDVLLGKGDGTFQSPVFYTTPLELNTEPISLVVADFNSDGHQDLLIGNGDTAWLLMGKGDGTLELGKMLTCPNGIITGGAADFNADGLVDAVVTLGAPGGVSGAAIFLQK